MRITIVLPSVGISGGIRVALDHARNLHGRGHKVVVVAGRPARRSTRSFIADTLRGRPFRARLNRQLFEGMGFPVRVLRPGRDLSARDVPDADVIIATWWRTAEWIEKLPASKGVPVVFLQGYEALPGQPKERVDAIWRSGMAKIVVSGWLRDLAASRFEAPVRLVPNGIDTDKFSCAAPRGKPERGTIGTLQTGLGKDSIKRFWLAVRTVEELHRRGRDCRFIGFGATRVDYAALPAGSCFEVAPAQSEISLVYGSCDCWLFTSSEEGYGLPILEAMSCGTPVVATRAGAAPELLASGGGILVDSDTPEDLADAVEHILNLDDASWRAMSRAARAEAEKHSWDRIGGKMEKALEEILAEHRARSDR